MDPRPEPAFYSFTDPESGTREFTQYILVPAQMRQIYSLFKEMNIDWANLDLVQVLDSLLADTHISRFVAIILREKGEKLQDKNLDELTKWVEYNVDKDTLIQIVKDFFGINDISNLLKGSFLKDLKEKVTTVQENLGTQPETSSKK